MMRISTTKSEQVLYIESAQTISKICKNECINEIRTTCYIDLESSCITLRWRDIVDEI